MVAEGEAMWMDLVLADWAERSWPWRGGIGLWVLGCGGGSGCGAEEVLLSWLALPAPCP